MERKRTGPPPIPPRQIQLCRILAIGPAGSGKTSILRRFMKKPFDARYSPTIGVDTYLRKSKVGKKEISTSIWDMGGLSPFLEIRQEFYYEDIQAVIMVFDVTSRDSFSDLGRWLTEAQTLFSKPVSVLVCGNKIDVIGKRAVSEVEARNWAASRNYMYAETSASMATNVDESLNALIQVVVDQAAMTKQAQLLEREKEARIKQIKQEITVIAGLPPAQREKKFKLLKAQYHPDRNQDNEALATFIFQYIQSEYERFQSAA
eukprot:TRINITY_DN8405_c0_g1_i2.p1 TRINITY_DN8405_c0_g1~~TRINITY_DN8405_c0_g1_i2.p1  ORF type:complete len:261 (+),score=45.84 TRINITY_DN8405_c0_g1_i2:60-842(+)